MFHHLKGLLFLVCLAALSTESRYRRRQQSPAPAGLISSVRSWSSIKPPYIDNTDGHSTARNEFDIINEARKSRRVSNPSGRGVHSYTRKRRISPFAKAKGRSPFNGPSSQDDTSALSSKNSFTLERNYPRKLTINPWQKSLGKSSSTWNRGIKPELHDYVY